MIPYLLQGITLGFSAAVSPGPLQAYMLAQASVHGWKKTAGVAFTPLLSDGPIILIVLLVLLQTPQWFLRGLYFAGGLFMLYLAYGAFHTFRTFTGEPAAPLERPHLLKATLVNLLSPSPWLFWSVAGGPILLDAWRSTPVNALLFVSSFWALLIGGNLLLIAFFATTRHMGPGVTRSLNAIAAVALLLFAIVQFYRGIRGP